MNLILLIFRTFRTHTPPFLPITGMLIAILFSLSGCKNRAYLTPSSIKIPYNYVLSWYPRYIIPQTHYAKIFAEKSLHSAVKTFIRRGDILKIKNIAGQDKDGFIWYHVSLSETNTAINSSLSDSKLPSEESTPLEGWVLLQSPIRTHSIEKAHFMAKKLRTHP